MEYGSCAEEVRSGQILESLWCSYYLGCIISSIPCLLCFIKNVSLILFFIRNLFCDSFGWWLLLDVISPCGLIVAQVWLWRESQRWWDVGVGFLFLWPSAIETGKNLFVPLYSCDLQTSAAGKIHLSCLCWSFQGQEHSPHWSGLMAALFWEL